VRSTRGVVEGEVHESAVGSLLHGVGPPWRLIGLLASGVSNPFGVSLPLSLGGAVLGTGRREPGGRLANRGEHGQGLQHLTETFTERVVVLRSGHNLHLLLSVLSACMFA
jgi:hypothetical protein